MHKHSNRVNRAKSLAAVQVERRLSRLRRIVKDATVRPGWIYFIRHAFGMTQNDLAKAAKLSAATVAQMEHREPEGRITLETLRKLANAMDCDMVCAIVPRKPIAKIVRERAIAKATEIIQRADEHMTLEDQRVKGSLKERIERLAEHLIDTDSVW